MPLTAWLIGDDTESILDDLTASGGHPRAQIWIPLESTTHTSSPQLRRYRSAWAHRTIDGEQWVDFALPADTILETIGAQALAHPKALTYGKALSSDVQTRDGALMAKVPRYFSTLATQWTLEQVGQDPLITRSGRETTCTTVGELDLKSSFRKGRGEPDLVIDHRGPRLLRRDKGRYYNVSGWKEPSRVMTEIRQLPPATPIRCAWCAD
ncbi:MAG TPA: hypothetical protein PK635_11005 [Actinomycetota bacterium]|nr:hypothetical protein [Actinomycetota bacterium]